MKVPIILHKSTERGLTKFKWLESVHSFSFGRYVNTQRTGFGTLAVFNDDTIAPQKGFSTHPHDNMEIITLVIEGTVQHQDSIGSKTDITAGEVQTMTAGTGVAHSEINPSDTQPVHLFQIWIEPREYGLKPRYQQKRFEQELFKNRLYPIVSGEKSKDNLTINQDASLFRGDLELGMIILYHLNPRRGLFVFSVEGSVKVNDQMISSRDSLEIKEVPSLTLTALSAAKLIVIEIPL